MPTILQTAQPSRDLAHEYLCAARKHFSQKEIAQELGVDTRTVRRWEARQSPIKPYLTPALQRLLPLQFSEFENPAFRFIDLFAGIGGIRIAFEAIGGRCVYTSEWDTYAQKTYSLNFRSGHGIDGDITKVSTKEIPSHDVLLAGFPCQPFSIAGVSKLNALGRQHGFACEAQGTLFFDVARILKDHKPRAFLLENVKNLASHDGGRTMDIILRTLRDDLGYHVTTRVIDGGHFVPQHRERILIVGFRESVAFDFNAIALPVKGAKRLRDVLHRIDGKEPVIKHDGDRFFDHAKRKVQPKYTLTSHLWTYLQNYARKHQEKGNGFGFGLVGPEDVARTLSARYYKDGSEILIDQGRRRSPRRLTPRECARLMGFPDSFQIPVSDTRAYKQFGNSVVVDVIHHVARLMQPFITAETLEPELPLHA